MTGGSSRELPEECLPQTGCELIKFAQLIRTGCCGDGNAQIQRRAVVSQEAGGCCLLAALLTRPQVTGLATPACSFPSCQAQRPTASPCSWAAASSALLGPRHDPAGLVQAAVPDPCTQQVGLARAGMQLLRRLQVNSWGGQVPTVGGQTPVSRCMSGARHPGRVQRQWVPRLPPSKMRLTREWVH